MKLTREVYPQPDFKKMSRFFVFVKINTDQQPNVARAFAVTGLPALKIMNASGKVVHEFVGYRPLGQFLQEMQKGRAAAGL